MPDNDILNLNSNLDDFELPPLPVRPVKKTDELSEAPTVDKDIDSELPVLPPKTIDDTLDEINTAVKGELPDADKLRSAADAVDTLSIDDDFELPPITKSAGDDKVEALENFEDIPDPEPVVTKPAEEIFDFEDEYDLDLDHIDTSSIILDDLTKDVAPLHTTTEDAARNIKETVKMNDLAMELTNTPVLDDLSDDYAAPEKKAPSLLERDKLEADEKRILKQHLNEDLSKRPEGFNARASQNMYNRLMEEKRLKTAKKGFALSLIPIIMGLASAGISATQLNWGSYLFFQYIAMFMVLAALLLFVKSKHVKLLSMAFYAVCLLIYVGLGLGMFVMDEAMRSSSDSIVHIVFTIIASALNIISIIILSKNEAVNIYYSSNFKKK